MQSILELRNLSIVFHSPGGPLPAVRNISLDVPAASTTCLVGESGCGKSLTCKAVMRLLPEQAALSGAINFQGLNVAEMDQGELCRLRGARIGMVFQEPMTSLNPVLTIGRQTAEPLRQHLNMNAREAREKVIALFHQVGIPDADKRYDAYPHQLSGGMRQRVMIAMALACGPALLLADEPTTALDATIQGQILRLIAQERRQRGMAVLLITHQLGVVAEVADVVGVMYAGVLMECATTEKLFTRPLHPYTRGLMACQPGRDSIGLSRLPSIPGTVPPLDQMPSGCPFHPRCAEAMDQCRRELPPDVDKDGQRVRCWLHA